MGTYGADVAQLRSLAAQFDRQASQLDAHRMTVGNAIRISAWMGPVAVRFRAQWDSDYSRRVHGAAGRLRAAAIDLRRNADEQDRASAVGGGAAGGLSGWVGATPEPSARTMPAFVEPSWQLDPHSLIDGVENIVSGAGAVDALNEVYKWGVKVPKILGPIGVMFDTATAVDALNDRDSVGAFLNGTSAVFGGIGVVASKVSPLAFGVSVAKTFVDWTIPYNEHSQDETYAKGVENVFGRDVDPSNLTGEQSQVMTKRYDGVLGVMNMISDRMDATADQIFPWNWGKKK
ncbi:hypothetical protein [Microbacterium sp. 22242]|uniref:hypothetical protein n=1 Tax=Microbacterium sp. 22242 TaxID=3453896 RepID=UPI003F834885